MQPDPPAVEGMPPLAGGYVAALGMTLVAAEADVAEVRWDAPGSMAHFTAAVETTCSIGASLWWGRRGRCVGMANTTTAFDLDARGPFTARATAVDRREDQQLWRTEITDGAGRPCGTGEVLLANLSG